MPIELEQKYVVVSERPWTVQAELLALLRRAGYGVELQGEKVIEKGVYVKMARGEMVRWMAEHAVERPEDLRQFDRLGFSYCPDRSRPEQLVFLMGQRPGSARRTGRDVSIA